jgi:REP element-mobilizing transposase RayT
MYGILKNLDCPAIKIGGTPNHVHILNSLSRTITQSKMIAILKRDSTKWIKSKDLRFQNFHWQNGYGVFSICKTNITSLIKYIENQKDHHRTKSFKEEYLEFLQKYKIDFNDKYLWD